MTRAADLEPGDVIVWTVADDVTATVTASQHDGRFTVSYVQHGRPMTYDWTSDPDRDILRPARPWLEPVREALAAIGRAGQLCDSRTGLRMLSEAAATLTAAFGDETRERQRVGGAS